MRLRATTAANDPPVVFVAHPRTIKNREYFGLRKAFEAAIDAVRGGQTVDNAEAEGQREALKKYTIDRSRYRQDS